MDILVLDGGFSTQLEKHVTEKVDGHPLWSARFLHNHEVHIFKTHLDFLDAGANVISTNSYQASIGGFKEYLSLNKTESIALIKKSVSIAQLARSAFLKKNSDATPPLIAGSVGSYGACLHDGSEYDGSFVGKVSSNELREWHRPRIQALLEAGVDMLALETIPALHEALALLDLIKEFPDAKAWLSFQCRDGAHTAYGDKFSIAVQRCMEQNPDQLLAIGCNCLDPRLVSPLLRSVKDHLGDQVPNFIVYPNSGEQYTVESGWVSKNDRLELSSFIPEWLELGVKYVGGCCRTVADDIKKIQITVEKWSFNNKKILDYNNLQTIKQH